MKIEEIYKRQEILSKKIEKLSEKEKEKRELYFLIGMFSMYIFSSFTLFPLINSLKEQDVITPLFWAFLPLGLCYITMKIMNKMLKGKSK